MQTFWNTFKDVVRGIPAVSLLALPLLSRGPRTLMVFLSDALRGYRRSMGYSAPAVMPAELMAARGPVSLRFGEFGVQAVHEGNYVLAELVAHLQPKRSFEFGTFLGQATLVIAMNSPSDAQVFTLDLPPTLDKIPDDASDLHIIRRMKSQLAQRLQGTDWYGTRIQQLYGDTKAFDYAPYHDSIDFCLIDASHTYSYVFNDSLAAFRMIRPGGVLLWHDYESMRSEYGVTRFCDRLRLHYKLPIRRLNGIYGDPRYAVLRVDAAAKHTLISIAAQPDSF